MSDCVCDAYFSLCKKTDNKNEVVFPGLKWELSQKLIDEFVAPLERNDIYNLCRCLDNELWQLGKIYRIASNFTIPEEKPVSDLLMLQTQLIGNLFNVKQYCKYLDNINSCNSSARQIKIRICKSISLAFEDNSKALLKYVYLSHHLEFVELVCDTLSEIECVMLNNN